MLKCLAGNYRPDRGRLDVSGRVSPFIELGVGFNPELTARDNVVVNAALLGISRAEALARFSEIIEFAELERFVDLKLKNFSSGMQVRLGFAAMIQAESGDLPRRRGARGRGCTVSRQMLRHLPPTEARATNRGVRDSRSRNGRALLRSCRAARGRRGGRHREAAGRHIDVPATRLQRLRDPMPTADGVGGGWRSRHPRGVVRGRWRSTHRHRSPRGRRAVLPSQVRHGDG